MLKTLQLGVIALVACICACADARSTESPRVVLGNIGTVIGINNSTSGLDSFLGIPYTQSPLGPLRWRLPAPLTSNPSRVIHATAWGPACIQAPVRTACPSGNRFLLGPDGFSPGAPRAPDHASCPSSHPRGPRAALMLTTHNIIIIH